MNRPPMLIIEIDGSNKELDHVEDVRRLVGYLIERFGSENVSGNYVSVTGEKCVAVILDQEAVDEIVSLDPSKSLWVENLIGTELWEHDWFFVDSDRRVQRVVLAYMTMPQLIDVGYVTYVAEPDGPLSWTWRTVSAWYPMHWKVGK